MKGIINRRGSKAATHALKRLGRTHYTTPAKTSEKPATAQRNNVDCNVCESIDKVATCNSCENLSFPGQ